MVDDVEFVVLRDDGGLYPYYTKVIDKLDNKRKYFQLNADFQGYAYSSLGGEDNTRDCDSEMDFQIREPCKLCKKSGKLCSQHHAPYDTPSNRKCLLQAIGHVEGYIPPDDENIAPTKGGASLRRDEEEVQRISQMTINDTPDSSGNLYEKVLEHREIERDLRTEVDKMVDERIANRFTSDVLARTNRKTANLLQRVRSVDTDIEYQERRNQAIRAAAATLNAKRGVQNAIDPFADSSDDD